jgi:Flp pilus assembly protein TadB
MSPGYAGTAAQLWMCTALLAASGSVAGLLLECWRAGRQRRRLGELLPAVPNQAASSGAELWSGEWRRSERWARLGTAEASRNEAGPRGLLAPLHRLTAAWPLKEGMGALGAGALALVLLGGTAGWLAAAMSGYAVWRWLRGAALGRLSADAESVSSARAAAGQLPLTANLLAACLAAGSSPGRAAEAVGQSVGGPLGERLVRAASELRLGGEPSAVWGRFDVLPGGVTFARCMERAATAGVPAAEPVARFAKELRARRIRAASTRARRVAVLVTAPLGLCFLPAFLVVGVAPVLLGLAHALA